MPPLQINKCDLRVVGTAIPWEAIFAFDIVIVSLTLFKAYSIHTTGRLRAGTYNLLDLLLWDGENIDPGRSNKSPDLQ